MEWARLSPELKLESAASTDLDFEYAYATGMDAHINYDQSLHIRARTEGLEAILLPC